MADSEMLLLSSKFTVVSIRLCLSMCSSGIGLGLVDEFVKRGAKLIISGRREAELQAVQARYPQHVLKYYISDASKEADRIALFTQVTADFPGLNVLVNNAGIQRMNDHTKEIQQPWSVRQQEIDINLSAPIHLTSLFIPHLLQQPHQAAVVFNTGAVSLMPISAFPVYCATKAAIHQYVMALRPLLADTIVRVVEAMPPAVKSGLHPNHGEECDKYCVSVVDALAAGRLEFGYRASEMIRLGDRQLWQQRGLEFGKQMSVVKFTSAAQ